MSLFKYECHTSSTALDLMSYISDRGGDVCIIMNGIEPTKTVLSTFSFSNKEDDTALVFVWRTSEPSKWDLNYFNNAIQ